MKYIAWKFNKWLYLYNEDTTASTSNTADDEIGIADENKITKNEDDKSSGGNDVDKDIGVPEKKPRSKIGSI